MLKRLYRDDPSRFHPFFSFIPSILFSMLAHLFPSSMFFLFLCFLFFIVQCNGSVK